MIQRLLDEPYRFTFFQAVHLIELWLQQAGALNDGVTGDYLRFRNSMSLSFPASQIEALALESGVSIRTTAELAAALQDKQLDGIVITPAFMSYLGANGVLPNQYTERICAAHLQRQDEGARSLLDIYLTRALELFHQASTKYRVEYIRNTQGDDGYLPLLLLLAGLAPAKRETTESRGGGLRDETLAYYATIIRRRIASGSDIANVLTEYFGVPFTILQFDGCWEAVPRNAQCTLGGPNATILGNGATLGVRRWTRDQRVRIRIGPLSENDFNRFIPGADGATALKKILGMFPCAPLQFRIQLVLRKEDVRPLHLEANGKFRLGRNTVLITRQMPTDHDSFQYDLQQW